MSILCTIAVSALLVGLPTDGQADEAKAAHQAISKVLSDQVDAWNKGDLKAFMAGYMRSEDITFFSGGTILKGWDAVLARYQKQYQSEGKEMGKLTFRDLDIQLLGADGAVVRGRYELVRSADKPSGLFTLILRKTPDGWRIIHDQTSSS
jgi:beta-aspartyl-peptidase (threonine type)